MKVTITIEGDFIGEVTRSYDGEYHNQHNKEWNDIVRDFLDDVKKYDDEKERGIEL